MKGGLLLQMYEELPFLFEPLSLWVLFEAPKRLLLKRQLKVTLFLPTIVTFLQSCLFSKFREPNIISSYLSGSPSMLLIILVVPL